MKTGIRQNRNEPDIIEKIAKDLCIKNGINPEDRIEMIPHKYNAQGELRTKPVWLNYKEEAFHVLRASQEIEAYPLIHSLNDRDNIRICGHHELSTIEQLLECMKDGNVVAGALCADGHKGYAQPIGGVIAYDNQISVSGVGSDISCGNLAVRLDVQASEIKDHLSRIADDLNRDISFGVSRSKDLNLEPSMTLDEAKSASVHAKPEHIVNLARKQLGTIGGGNHYLDVFEDEDGFVWIGVHFGSRGIGAMIYNHFMKASKRRDGENTILDLSSDLGERYKLSMEMAGRFAWEGREYAVELARQIIGGNITKRVHNFHNYAWEESHRGKLLTVVRKGSTPCFPNQEGFVGGSMGDNAVIVEGIDSEESKRMLYSTIHGAGRVFGRKQAKDIFRKEDMMKWMHSKNIQLRGGELDESPMAYRRLTDVLREHEQTTKVNHILKPLIVLMAGNDVIDPYKD